MRPRPRSLPAGIGLPAAPISSTTRPLGDENREWAPHSCRPGGEVMAHTDDVLSETPLFEALSEEDATALRSGVIDVHLDRGERLFSEGDTGDKLYIILA